MIEIPRCTKWKIEIEIRIEDSFTDPFQFTLESVNYEMDQKREYLFTSCSWNNFMRIWSNKIADVDYLYMY